MSEFYYTILSTDKNTDMTSNQNCHAINPLQFIRNERRKIMNSRELQETFLSDKAKTLLLHCPLYTPDAADDPLRLYLAGRRIPD
mgnify:CR=1 FL=1